MLITATSDCLLSSALENGVKYACHLACPPEK